MNVPLFELKSQYPAVRNDVRAALERIFERQQFVLGPEGEALEAEIARYCQTKFAIGCASGSDALLLALMSLGIGDGDEVITTPFTFFATAAAITRVGARPIFVDIDSDTFNMDVTRVEAAISARTRAIIAVHLYGQCVDMQPLLELAAKHRLPIIEDTAQAIGAEDRGRRAGSMGTMGCLSFYPSKNLGAAGDAGMLVTNDEEHARRLRMLHVHGEERRYYHAMVGINSRLDEIQAAVLRAKLPHLDDWTRARQRIVQHYQAKFSDAGLNEHIALPRTRDDAKHVFHLFVIRVAANVRDALRNQLTASGIGNGVYYPVPLHLLECFQYLGFKNGDFPNTETAAVETLALPAFPEMTDVQLDHVVNTIASFFQTN